MFCGWSFNRGVYTVFTYLQFTYLLPLYCSVTTNIYRMVESNSKKSTRPVHVKKSDPIKQLDQVRYKRAQKNLISTFFFRFNVIITMYITTVYISFCVIHFIISAFARYFVAFCQRLYEYMDGIYGYGWNFTGAVVSAILAFVTPGTQLFYCS